MPSESRRDWKPSHNPWIVAITVTLATFMEVLDSSIANVSLPHIAGSLGATYEESTWVLTSYLVSSAIVLPVSGWLSMVIGRKRFYMLCVALFTICSFYVASHKVCPCWLLLACCKVPVGADCSLLSRQFSPTRSRLRTVQWRSLSMEWRSL